MTNCKKSYVVPESAAVQVLESVFLMKAGTLELSGATGAGDADDDPNNVVWGAPKRRPF